MASAEELALAAKEAAITSTLGISVTTLRSRLEGGESLAVIAGAKKDDLILALSNVAIIQTDLRVSEGTLTAEEASVIKQNMADEISNLLSFVLPTEAAPTSKKFAVLDGINIINTILADSLEIAQEVTGKTCVEFTVEPAEPGGQYVDGQFIKSV